MPERLTPDVIRYVVGDTWSSFRQHRWRAGRSSPRRPPSTPSEAEMAPLAHCVCHNLRAGGATHEAPKGLLVQGITDPWCPVPRSERARSRGGSGLPMSDRAREIPAMTKGRLLFLAAAAALLVVLPAASALADHTCTVGPTCSTLYRCLPTFPEV